MQQLADWVEQEVAGNQDPRVQLRYYGGMSADTEKNITYVTPLGALVQMFEPFKLTDGKQHLLYDLVLVSESMVHTRVASVLGIEQRDVTTLVQYLFEHCYTTMGIDNLEVVKALRTLK